MVTRLTESVRKEQLPMSATLIEAKRQVADAGADEKAELMASLLVIEESAKEPGLARSYYWIAALAGLLFWALLLSFG